MSPRNNSHICKNHAIALRTVCDSEAAVNPLRRIISSPRNVLGGGPFRRSPHRHMLSAPLTDDAPRLYQY